MPNLAAIATPATHLFGEGQNQSLPRLAAICAALCLALLACAQSTPPTALPPDDATPTPTTQPTPTSAPPSAAATPIAAQPTPSPAPTAVHAPPNVAIPTPAAQPTPAPAAPASQPLALAATPVAQPVPLQDVVFTQITTGATHACGLREPAAPLCWGEDPNAHGILDAPAQTDFTQISAGLNFTCALRQDGTIACWGDNSAGQATPPQGAFTEIAAGQNHACAIPVSQDAPPALICWGHQFPNGAETLPLDAPLSNIQTGAGFICGLAPQADMACLSIDTRLTEITPGPFTQLAIGEAHICALRENGSAFCQGKNDLRPVNPPSAKFAQIAAGRFHDCGITRANRLECWRSALNGAGEPIPAPDGEFAALSINWRNSCALRPNGRAVCWHTPDYLPNNPHDRTRVGIDEAFGGAMFNFPVEIFPWQNGGVAIVHRNGIIAAHYDRPNAPPSQPILDIADSVNPGMLSAALDPQFDEFPFLYVWYTERVDDATDEEMPGFVGRLSRFRINNGVAIRGSELAILEMPTPIHAHLGGAIRFGADGMLYLSIGDNGEPDNAQSLENLKGKIIRIDVRGANPDKPYGVPPDNPFMNNPNARPEIWAYGLRNPWRMAFDPINPANLFVADVGKRTWEEVSIVTAGANLGWPLCEGYACHPNVDFAALTPPAVAYNRKGAASSCAIIGGVTVPWLDNGFIVGDLCSRRVWLLERDSPHDGSQDDPQAWRMREIADLSSLRRNIIAFGAAADGSVYVMSRNGPILRLGLILADNPLNGPSHE